MHQSTFGPGSPVTFDSEHGPQRGTVDAIRCDISNGAKLATVIVAGTLSGAPWTVPINDLRHVEAA